MRLFYALWPEPDTQRHWLQACAPALSALGGQLLPAANLHLTLKFLGETRADRVPALIRLGDDVAAAAVSLRFDRIECWGRGDLACLRAEPSAELLRLVGHLDHGLQVLGLAPDTRRFKTHVTLARRLQHAVPSLPLWPPLDWRATMLALVSSRLAAEGPSYHAVARWSLQDAPIGARSG